MAIKIITDLKRLKTSLSSTSSPGEATPPSLASSIPLQPAIKNEDVQAILKRDLASSSVYPFEEMCLLERSLYPDFPFSDNASSREQFADIDLGDTAGIHPFNPFHSKINLCRKGPKIAIWR